MAGVCLYDEGSLYKVESFYDGAVYDGICFDCVKGGTFNEFNEGHTATSLTMQIASGLGIVCGAFAVFDNATQVELQASTSDLYIVARIDKTRPNGSKAQIEVKTEVQLKQENLNGSGNIRDLLLYKVSTDASGVISVVDLRLIKGETLYIKSLNISGTPEALESYCDWDENEEYGYCLDISVSGINTGNEVDNIVLSSSFDGASVISTLKDKLRFYFSSNSAVDSVAYDIVIK